MYTRQEASKLREEFWTVFGKYMAPIPSAEGIPINWVNYKTGIKDVSFFMEADNKKAGIGIQILHKDPEIQQLFFEEFKKLEETLEQHLDEKWLWILHSYNEHAKTVSRIYTEISSVNIFNKDDWPTIISFFKPRIIALDDFWCNWKYGFEERRF